MRIWAKIKVALFSIGIFVAMLSGIVLWFLITWLAWLLIIGLIALLLAYLLVFDEDDEEKNSPN